MNSSFYYYILLTHKNVIETRKINTLTQLLLCLCNVRIVCMILKKNFKIPTLFSTYKIHFMIIFYSGCIQILEQENDDFDLGK